MLTHDLFRADIVLFLFARYRTLNFYYAAIQIIVNGFFHRRLLFLYFVVSAVCVCLSECG